MHVHWFYLIVDCASTFNWLIVPFVVFGRVNSLFILDRATVTSLRIHKFSLTKDTVVISVTCHNFLLLAVQCTTRLGLARDLVRVTCEHLNFLNDGLILQNFLCQSLSLTCSWGLSTYLRLTASFEWTIQISTSTKVCSLQNDHVVCRLVFIQTAAMLLQWLRAALWIYWIYLFLLWKRVLELFLVYWLACTGRLCHLRAENHVCIYCPRGLITFGVFLVHNLVGQIYNLYTLAACTCSRLLYLGLLS